MPTRLGIDIGGNSIGWMLYALDESGGVVGVRGAGVRIFPDGRTAAKDDAKGAPANHERRAARMMRRRRDRYAQRRDATLAALQQFGLLPENKKALRNLQDENPWEIRARAAREKIPLFHLGRAMFHLGQRRGFKSGRLADRDAEGPVRASVENFQRRLGGQTVGQFLSARLSEQPDGKKTGIRARREGANDLYAFYPGRNMIEEEFNSVWEKQRAFYPAELSEDKRAALFGVIFHQRPMKPPVVGVCRFFPEEERAPKALPSFQRFRILREVNNLRVCGNGGEELPLSPEARKDALGALLGGRNLTFKQLSRLLKKQGDIESDAIFNLQDEKRRDIKGNITAKIMQDTVGDAWNALDAKRQDALALLLLDDSADDDQLRRLLTANFGFSESQAGACIAKAAALSGKPENTGRAALSAKAIAILMPYLEKGMTYSEAKDRAARAKQLKEPDAPDGCASRLPRYPKVLGEWCVPRRKEDADEHALWRIPNPTVHIALNQLRLVVNDIFRRHGKPDSAVVELARDLPLGQDAKRKLTGRQRENQKANKGFRKMIEALNQTPTPEAMLRVRLWHELADDSAARLCAYCGRHIGEAAVLSAAFEIDHILPFSQTLDDDIANKVLCCRQCSRDKGNQTPHEAWGGDKARWRGIWERARRFPRSKRMRFAPDALKTFRREDGGFLARQLSDTQYIAKATRRYLEAALPKNKIEVVPGRLTAMLRRLWGMNDILGEDGKKNRADHRHHAVDAAVVGAASRAVLQKFASASRKSEDGFFELIPPPPPLDDFRNEVAAAVHGIVVSHKPGRRRAGKLHNDTAYGLPEGFDEKKKAQIVVHRILLADLDKSKAEKIAAAEGSLMKKELIALCESFTANKTELRRQLQEYGERHNIRRIPIRENLLVIPIRDKDGRIYKAYKGDNNWAMDVYEKTPGGRWEGEVISIFNANQTGFAPQWRTERPDAKMMMRLHINDMVAVSKDDGGREIYRVSGISEGKIHLTPHADASPAKESASRIVKSPDALKKWGIRKIHVSPSGLIKDPGRHNTADKIIAIAC